MKISISVLFFALFPVLIFTGCSDKTQISGQVTYTDETPVYPGKVCFTAGKNTFYGRLNKEGRYSVGEFKDGEGIPAGKYDVWVAETGYAVEIIKNGKPTGLYDSVERVSAKYTNPNPECPKYELKRGGSKTFDFTVEKP
jgi:hypothetical protein